MSLLCAFFGHKFWWKGISNDGRFRTRNDMDECERCGVPRKNAWAIKGPLKPSEFLTIFKNVKGAGILTSIEIGIGEGDSVELFLSADGYVKWKNKKPAPKPGDVKGF